MSMRLLFAAIDDESLDLMCSTLDAALHLTPLDVNVAQASTSDEVLTRVDSQSDDVIFLDWPVTGADTPALVREILRRNPLLRVVVLLPEQQRQYRQLVWEAGACNGIPKEHMDQEWLSAVLCIMFRAMQHEAHFLEKRKMVSSRRTE